MTYCYEVDYLRLSSPCSTLSTHRYCVYV
uniref:Uncharacterized protein n=1 Tax=Anguilla anguilla TaxID=7936 RepID=A0A0E9SSE6_ANGAN